MQVPDNTTNSVVLLSGQPAYAAGKSPTRRNSIGKNQIASFLQKRIKKTKICVHFLSGRCSHGNQCSFAHSVEELRDVPNLYKTRLCVDYAKSPEGCARGNDCKYAHGMEELRSTEEVYKTALCLSWNANGTCPSGDRCRWAHGLDELRTLAPAEFPQPFDNQHKKRSSASLPNTRRKERLATSPIPDHSIHNCIDTTNATAVENLYSPAYIGNVPLLQNNYPFLQQNFGLATNANIPAGTIPGYDTNALCYEDYHHPAAATAATTAAMLAPTFSVPGYYSLIAQQQQQALHTVTPDSLIQRSASNCNYSVASILECQEASNTIDHTNDASLLSQSSCPANLDSVAQIEFSKANENENHGTSPQKVSQE